MYISTQNEPPNTDPTEERRNTHRVNTIKKKVWEIQVKRSF